MRPRHQILGMLAACVVASSPDVAGADASLYYSLNGETGVTIRMHGGRIGLFETDRLTLVYDDGTKSYTYLDHRDRVYTVISEKWLQEATRRAQEISKQTQARMEQQAQDLPPQYRQMYQQGKMMTPFMGPMMNPQSQPSQPPMHVPAFGPGQAAGYPCRRMDIMQGGKKTQQVCIASPASLGISAADWNMFRAWLATNDRLAKQGAFTFGFSAPLIVSPGSGLQGIPIEITDPDAGTTLLLSSVDVEGDVDPADLQPPEDYLEARIPVPGL